MKRKIKDFVMFTAHTPKRKSGVPFTSNYKPSFTCYAYAEKLEVFCLGGGGEAYPVGTLGLCRDGGKT